MRFCQHLYFAKANITIKINKYTIYRGKKKNVSTEYKKTIKNSLNAYKKGGHNTRLLKANSEYKSIDSNLLFVVFFLYEFLVIIVVGKNACDRIRNTAARRKEYRDWFFGNNYNFFAILNHMKVLVKIFFQFFSRNFYHKSSPFVIIHWFQNKSNFFIIMSC